MKKIDEMLMTEVREIRYDYITKIGRLFMASECCCDMTACIKLFEELDPQVTLIFTLAGDERDTCYVKTDDEWNAIRAPSFHRIGFDFPRVDYRGYGGKHS